MLSQQNIDKLNMNGVYESVPMNEYGRIDNPYHCRNWTFRVYENQDGEYFMKDTYWDSSDSLTIRLTDENFDEFEFLFDETEVKEISEKEVNHYENAFRVAIDSGGWGFPKIFVNESDAKCLELVINDTDREIEDHQFQIDILMSKKERLLTGQYKI